MTCQGVSKVMNTNKQIISSWLQTVSQSPSPSPAGLPCVCVQEGARPQFYQHFLADPSSYRADQFSFSPSLEVSEAGLVTGQGTVTRRGTWVWPVFSGWTSWQAVAGGQLGLHSVTGQFRQGTLCGQAKLKFCNDLTFLLQLQCGVLQGLCLAWYQDHLVWAGQYEEGKLGERACSLDWESGALLWAERTFLYPDMTTALTGAWREGELVSARQAEVQTITVREDDLLDIVCSPPTGPTFSYAPSGPDSFGSSDPGLRDPYESAYISVGRSGIEDSGQGVFAVTDLPPGSLAAVFNGYKVALCSGVDPAAGLTSLEEIYERLAYNIHMPEDENFYIDFPPEQAELSVYSASLGHKVNHSFHPNSVFGTMHHPRWGRVRTVVTASWVKAGQELLVDYGYDLIRCPDWYRDMWTATIGAATGKNYWEYNRK